MGPDLFVRDLAEGEIRKTPFSERVKLSTLGAKSFEEVSSWTGVENGRFLSA
jgi:hypothetical protein